MQIKTAKFRCPCAQRANSVSIWHYFKLSSRPNSNRRLSASVPLTAIAQAIQKRYICTDAQTGQRHKAESGSNRFYEHPGYEATFLATLEQRADIAISLCKQF